MYLGDVLLGETLVDFFQIVNSSGTPKEPTGTPAVRIYNASGITHSAITPTSADTKNLTGSPTVTNPANPNNCVVNCTGHGLHVGQVVTIAGVTGHALTVNGDFSVVSPTSDTFQIAVTGNSGATGSSGSFKVTGLYKWSIVCSGANGFAKGELYTVQITYVVSGTTYTITRTFMVV